MMHHPGLVQTGVHSYQYTKPGRLEFFCGSISPDFLLIAEPEKLGAELKRAGEGVLMKAIVEVAAAEIKRALGIELREPVLGRDGRQVEEWVFVVELFE